jgi:hypothetical protein
MLIDRLDDFVRLAKEIEFGRIEDVTFDIDDGDFVRADSEPMRKFLKTLRDRNGSATFGVLKIQNGLPMFGEIEIRKGAIQSHKWA